MSFSFFRFYNGLIAKNLQNTSKNCTKTPDSHSVILQAILPNLKSQSFAENKSFVPDVRMSHSALFSRHSAIPANSYSLWLSTPTRPFSDLKIRYGNRYQDDNRDNNDNGDNAKYV